MFCLAIERFVASFMCYLLIDLLHCNLQKQEVHYHVPAKEGCSTDIQRVRDANNIRNQKKELCMAQAKIRLLLKDLDTATNRIAELKRGWNSTIEDGLDAAADLEKLVSNNFVPNSADADVHEINRIILDQVKARAEILRTSLQVDDFQRVMQEPAM